MEQVGQVHRDRSRWLAQMQSVVLWLIGVIIVAFSIGHAFLWAGAEIIAAPLTALAFGLLLVLPGLALLRLFWPESLALAERVALAIGLSCAMIPLLLLLSLPFGIRWNGWLAWGWLILAAAILIWPTRKASGPAATTPPQQRLQPPQNEALLLTLITIAALVIQLYAVRDLPTGMWGDSYQHTVMAQLIAEHGGIFSSWQPYAPLATFTYHFGFHSTVAWLNWLSDTPTTQGLLIVGQVQSALAAPMLYLFTHRLTGNGRAALWAAIVAAFVSAMPAYYVNWGRYTQLAGQTILPATGVIWMALIDAATEPRVARGKVARLIMLATIITAGLALTHYRVAVFAACFVVAYAIAALAARVRSWSEMVWLVGAGAATGGLTLIVIAPWLIRMREGALLRIGQQFLANNIGAENTNTLPPWSDILTLYTKPYLLILTLIGVIMLTRRRQWRGLTLLGWALLVWLAANPYLIGMNGAGILTNFAVLIASYLVVAPLCGSALDAIATLLARIPRITPIIQRGYPLAGLLLVVWGSGWQQQIIQPQYQLFTTADAQAMDWIRAETEPDARFFVNSFPAYNDTLYAGSDGGWWLPFFTLRQSNLPPLTYGSEAGERADYYRSINAVNAEILAHPVDTPEAAAALRAAAFDYLYDGPTANPADEYIVPERLRSSPLYELVYDQSSVTIWRVR